MLHRTNDRSTWQDLAARLPISRAAHPQTEANARLTSLIGLVLLVLLFVEGITVLGVREMLTIHVFVGLLLIPPILAKLASTGYRFARYYLGNPQYRAAGPPQIILRMIAPVMVAATVVLFGSGVALLLAGPEGRDTWMTLHQGSFFIWFCLMSVHVLAHTGRAFTLGVADLLYRGSTVGVVRGAITRQSFVLGSIVLGVVVAFVFLPLDASWMDWSSRFHFDH